MSRRAFVSVVTPTPLGKLRYGACCAIRAYRDTRWGRVKQPARVVMTAAGGGAGEAASVAQRIAENFVQACQPGNKPYVDALQDFCTSVMDAYRSGYSLQALQFELSANRGGSGGRMLQNDEVELRSVWLTLCFKTLRQIGFPVDADAAARSSVTYDKMDEFVQNIVAAVKAGYDMKRIQLEQALGQGASEKPRTSLESAILGQSTRLVITTIAAASDAMGGSSPQTPLPQ